MDDSRPRTPPHEPGHLRGVLAAARARRDAGIDRVALLVIATRGSTYRKAGALALVDAAGRAVGSLSGGCLEVELARAARSALASGAAQVLVLDTQSDADLVFGSGSGCRGTMDVLVLPQRAGRDADLFDVVDRAAQAGAPARLALRIDDRAVGAWRELGDGERADALETPVWIAPPPRVLLIGAGPEAPPLTRLLRGMGWFVDVADHRPALLDAARLPDADALIAHRPGAALARLAGPPHAAALVMTHLASADLEALTALAAHPGVGYVGLLGPRARREELIARLDADSRDRLLPRLHGPAGLDLGGDGPEAIALSIAAALHRHVAASRATSAREPPA